LFFPQNSQYRESQRGADEACLAETAVHPNKLSLFHTLICIIVLCKLMQLEVYFYSFEERYHQNTVSLFFESLLKLSEGGEIKKCWITQRWKRSM